jgi:hypothetical protein
MDFNMKNTLKSNRNHTPKQAASLNKDLRTSKPMCMHMLITNTSIHCLDHEKRKSNPNESSIHVKWILYLSFGDNVETILLWHTKSWLLCIKSSRFLAILVGPCKISIGK